MIVALISCVSKKTLHSAMAKDLYISPLFRGAYKYAKKQCADKIFILSAKYGLVSENKIIDSYDETLNTKSKIEIIKWAENVLLDLSKEADLKKDRFLILAGEKYRKFIIGELENYTIPLKGLSIGKQLSYYKGELE